MTPEIAKILARCRSAIAAFRAAVRQRNAGNEPRAQALEHRATVVKLATVRERLERAKQLRDQRLARNAGVSLPAGPRTAKSARGKAPQGGRVLSDHDREVLERIRRAREAHTQRTGEGTSTRSAPGKKASKTSHSGAAKGTQLPTTAWATKTGRAYDRRFRAIWREFEGQEIGDGWRVGSVNRRLGTKIQPDLVLVNDKRKEIVAHDVTSHLEQSHLDKGERYKAFLKRKYPGYQVEYTESYWEGLENRVEAKARSGELYFPGDTKP